MAFLNFNFLLFILFFPYLFFFHPHVSFLFFLFLFFSPPHLSLIFIFTFLFFFCSLALRLSSLHFTFFLFFSSCTPLELSSLFFFRFSFLLFIYSRAFKKLSLSFSLSHKQILSHTHIDHRQRSGDCRFCASPLFFDEKQREGFFSKEKQERDGVKKKKKGRKEKKVFF